MGSDNSSNLFCLIISNCSCITAITDISIRVRSGDATDQLFSSNCRRIAAALHIVMETHTAHDSSNLDIAADTS